MTNLILIQNCWRVVDNPMLNMVIDGSFVLIGNIGWNRHTVNSFDVKKSQAFEDFAIASALEFKQTLKNDFGLTISLFQQCPQRYCCHY